MCTDINWGGACKTLTTPLDKCTRFDANFTKQVSSMRTTNACVQCKGAPLNHPGLCILVLTCVPQDFRTSEHDPVDYCTPSDTKQRARLQ